MQKLNFRTKTFPLFLLLISTLSFGILVPTLGFYWDDWPMAWFAHTLGPTGFISVFEGDRPFLAGIYMITTSMLSLIPYQWQILGILSRLLTALVVWWTARQLWPQKAELTAWIALLFTVFPGFKQQSISIVYSNAFFLLSFYILSFGLNILAIRNSRRYWLYTLLALVSYSICAFSTEYYLGLDLLRGFMIWLVVREFTAHKKEQILKTIRLWVPYLVNLAIFLIWRVLIFKFPTYRPELFEKVAPSPITTVVQLFDRIIQDVFKMGWLAWIEPFRFPKLADFNLSSNSVYWGIVLTCFLSGWFYLNNFQKTNHEKVTKSSFIIERKSGKIITLTGLVALFSGGWSFWIASLPVELQFPYDRFSLAFMFGSCILIVGLLEWLISSHGQRIFILALLVAMAAGSNFDTANSFRREWNVQKDMFWQLTWRVPGLKPGTLLLTHNLPIHYFSDNSLTAPLNWIYAPDNKSLNLPYFLGFTDVRLGGSIPSFEENKPVTQGYRNAMYKGSTSQALVYFYSPPGCLRILDPDRDSDLPIFPVEMYDPIKISHPSQILINPLAPARPPENIFGQEPEHDWCYHFEKADLARQQGDWPQVVKIGDQAFDNHLSTKEASELVIFVEGYARTGNWVRATDLANLSFNLSQNMQYKLCQVLHQVNNEYPADGGNRVALSITSAKMGCPLQ